MALTQTADTFVVNHGTAGGWNPTAMTVIQWVRFTNLPASSGWGNSCRMWSKGDFLNDPEFFTCSARIDSVGDIRMERSHYNGGSYTWLDVRTDSTPIAAGTTSLIAYVMADTGTQRGKIYTGTLTTLAAEATYSTQTDPSGTADDVSGDDLYSMGGIEGANGLDGAVTLTAMYAEALTLPQIQAIQMQPSLLFARSAASKKLIAFHGWNGATNVPDWSGNGYTGTITSGAVAAGAPIVNPFARTVTDDEAWATSAAGLSVPIAAMHYRKLIGAM